MTFAQQRNRLTTHFSEGIPVVKRRISVLVLYLSSHKRVLAKQDRDRLSFTLLFPSVTRRQLPFKDDLRPHCTGIYHFPVMSVFLFNKMVPANVFVANGSHLLHQLSNFKVYFHELILVKIALQLFRITNTLYIFYI